MYINVNDTDLKVVNEINEVIENCIIEKTTIDESERMRYVHYKNVVFKKVVIQDIAVKFCVFDNCKFIKCAFGENATARDRFYKCAFSNCEFYKCCFISSIHSSVFYKCRSIKCQYTDHCYIAYTKYYDCVMYKCILQMTCKDCTLTNLDVSTCKFTEDVLFEDTSLSHAKLPKKEKYRRGIRLTKPIFGYKISAEHIVVVAEIPAGAIVYSVNGGKCRTNIAHIKKFRTKANKKSTETVVSSKYDFTFKYHIGDVVQIKDFDKRHYVECAAGFHFFKTFDEAVEYD